MKLEWTISQGNKKVKLKFLYDIYLGRKKLYIGGKKVITSKLKNWNTEFNFIFNSEEYTIKLVQDGYNYEGYLLTSKGERVPSKTQNETSYIIYLWTIPFLILNMLIPIISVEALRPWVIGLISSYVIVMYSNTTKHTTFYKICVAFGISILAWLSYYIFYICVRRYGFLGGFIPFIK